MRRLKYLVVSGLLLAGVVGCGASGGLQSGGGAIPEGKRSGKKDAAGHEVAAEAVEEFRGGLDSFAAIDKSQDWTEGNCDSIAKKFEAASDQQEKYGKELPEALYNAALAYQRCGDDAKAQKLFEKARAAGQGFHYARAQIALYDFKRNGNVDGAIRDLDSIIRDAKFQNVEALVGLAALQMERGGDQAGQGCANDIECAKLNLQRALAIDDSYMPAYNQLALYYTEQARRKAAGESKPTSRNKRGMVVSGVRGVEVNSQQLDLAALVAGQAQKKNPRYAPIHNTTGLIQVELKNYNSAVQSFATARKLDPKFFEAHMNYAAVNLSFRGFSEAEKAYRDALKLRPNEYEAHLGLALALRGQVTLENWDQKVKEAQAALDQAKKVAPNRAETYYNQAILTHEFVAKRAGEAQKAIPVLENAEKQYREFISKAGGDSVLAAAVKRSEERAKDIQDTIKFIREGQAAEKEAAEIAKQQKLDEERLKKEEAENKKKEEAEKKAADEKAAKEKADKAKSDKEKADKEKADKDNAAQEKADKEKAVKDKAAQDQAAKDKAAKDKAAAKTEADKAKAAPAGKDAKPAETKPAAKPDAKTAPPAGDKKPAPEAKPAPAPAPKKDPKK